MCASPPPAPSPTNPPTHPQALIHFILEGSFVYLATFGRAVSISSGPFPALWMEYACGDVRWAHADLTVLAAGPLCVYMLILLAKGGPAYHYCVVVLGTAEIYGRCMTFVPKGLAGSLNLLTSSWMYAWVYLFVSGSSYC